ncbi:MAG: hypothetical protein WD556_07235 [Actinomycetota bacterium]
MLHMIVTTHTPEDCAFRGEEEEKLLVGGYDRFTDAPGTDISVVGAWVNRASHESFTLVDAPNAHDIERSLLDAGLVGRTHSRILSVVETDNATSDR